MRGQFIWTKPKWIRWLRKFILCTLLGMHEIFPSNKKPRDGVGILYGCRRHCGFMKRGPEEDCPADKPTMDGPIGTWAGGRYEQ